MIKSFLTGGGEHPRERVKDLVMEDHLECGCLGSDRVDTHDDQPVDGNHAGSRRRLFDLFLGITLGSYFFQLSSLHLSSHDHF